MTALAWPKGWAMLDSEFFHAPMLSIRATEETVDLLRICHVAIMQQSQLTNAQMTDSENAWSFPRCPQLIIIGSWLGQDRRSAITKGILLLRRSLSCGVVTAANKSDQK
jgi:hypothetical protein